MDPWQSGNHAVTFTRTMKLLDIELSRGLPPLDLEDCCAKIHALQLETPLHTYMHCHSYEEKQITG